MEWSDMFLIQLAKHRYVETERLLLRPMSLDDLADYHEYTSDEEVVQYDYPPHRDLAESEYNLVKWNLAQPLGRYGLELRSQGKLIGNISLRYYEDEIVEIGYTVNKHYWRQGLGSEAVNALCQLALGELGVKHLIAKVDVKNIASIRLLESCHFEKMTADKQGQYLYQR